VWSFHLKAIILSAAAAAAAAVVVADGVHVVPLCALLLTQALCDNCTRTKSPQPQPQNSVGQNRPQQLATKDNWSVLVSTGQVKPKFSQVTSLQPSGPREHSNSK